MTDLSNRQMAQLLELVQFMASTALGCPVEALTVGALQRYWRSAGLRAHPVLPTAAPLMRRLEAFAGWESPAEYSASLHSCCNGTSPCPFWVLWVGDSERNAVRGNPPHRLPSGRQIRYHPPRRSRSRWRRRPWFRLRRGLLFLSRLRLRLGLLPRLRLDHRVWVGA